MDTVENRSRSGVSKEEQVFIRAGERNISAACHVPGGSGPFPFVILSHGLLSDKDSPKYTGIARMLVDEGIGAIRFDYEGCGRSDGLLEETTISGRLKNLQAVIDYALRREECSGKLGLMGSSLGGYLSILQAARDKRVLATVVWATPSHLKDIDRDRERGDLKRLGDCFYREIDRYDLLEEAERVGNCLIIHGQMDEMVPINHARMLYERIKEPKELYIIPTGDHRLTGPKDREKATEKTVAWFRKFL